MRRSTLLGLIGIFGIWLTAGLALPFVNVLNGFTVEQLMVARGLVTALLAVVLLRMRIFPVDRYALLSGLSFAGGCVGLYHGIREFGPSLTIVFFTTAPVVNFAIAWRKRRHVSLAAITSLFIMIVGVVIALRPWGGHNKLSAQGETPAVILMSGLILGDKLNFLQWVGVAISLYGAWYLSRWLSNKKT